MVRTADAARVAAAEQITLRKRGGTPLGVAVVPRTKNRAALIRTPWGACVSTRTKRTASCGRAVRFADATEVAGIPSARRLAQGVARIAEGIAVRARTSRFADTDSAATVPAAEGVAKPALSGYGAGNITGDGVGLRQDHRSPRRRLVRSDSVDAGLLHPTEAVDMQRDHYTRNKQNVIHQPALRTGFVFWVDARPVQRGYPLTLAVPLEPLVRIAHEGGRHSLCSATGTCALHMSPGPIAKWSRGNGPCAGAFPVVARSSWTISARCGGYRLSLIALNRGEQTPLSWPSTPSRPSRHRSRKHPASVKPA
jgi:hypothetical protein